MLPDRVSNPGPLTYEAGALLIALCGLAIWRMKSVMGHFDLSSVRHSYKRRRKKEFRFASQIS